MLQFPCRCHGLLNQVIFIASGPMYHNHRTTSLGVLSMSQSTYYYDEISVIATAILKQLYLHCDHSSETLSNCHCRQVPVPLSTF